MIKDLELGKVYTDKDRPPFKVESANENTAPNHDGKSAPHGSGYEEVDEKVNPEIKQIYKLLMKYGVSAKETAKMMKKHWKYVSKKYKNSSPRGIATALIGLHSLGEGTQKQRNELALHIIDLNNMLGQAKLSKNPNTKKYIKLLQQDLKDAKSKLGKLKK